MITTYALTAVGNTAALAHGDSWQCRLRGI